MNHTFSTDLLNQILFAEQSFRSEFSFLLDRLSSERPKTATGGAALLNVNPILFNLELKGEGVPWLQVTASTPTSTAIRFTIDSPHAVLTNRLTNCSTTNETTEEPKQTSPIDRLFGRAKVQLNVKLGQLYKNALYEETQEELEEYANFMTQISVQNEESITKDSIHSYLISLNRPLLLIKSNAIDKAILLWLNYRNTYNYWREERNKLLVMSNRVYEKKRKKSTREIFGKLEQPATHPDQKQGDGSIDGDRSSAPPSSSSSNFVTDMNINLSLSIPNGLYICMPLYSPEINDSMAALVVSLQKSDVTVCVKKELACLASFTAFKVTFIDNFDEQSLSEPWLAENAAGGESLHSNFFFFPHGSYSFCTSAISPSAHNQNAKWILCVKSHMQGMVIDFDYKIGKLTSLLIHTLSSFASDDDVVEEYAPSDSSFAYTSATQPSRQQPRLSMQSSMDNNPAMDNQSNMMEDSQHFQSTLGNWMKKMKSLLEKMHEQSVLVTDLISHRPRMSELMIEKERRKLRILELVRFKQFRQSMWDKIRQKVNTRTHHLSGNSSKNDDNNSNSKVAQTQRQPSRSLLSANSSSTPAASSHANLLPEYASGGHQLLPKHTTNSSK
uniref:Bridge-like lipid transfer protein family member 1 C-terminal domain-containing protein n=1 Tax=Ditylenchus dipsaci TaxID=166011 RepID=A0A915EB37_9BILA